MDKVCIFWLTPSEKMPLTICLVIVYCILIYGGGIIGTANFNCKGKIQIRRLDIRRAGVPNGAAKWMKVESWNGEPYKKVGGRKRKSSVSPACSAWPKHRWMWSTRVKSFINQTHIVLVFFNGVHSGSLKWRILIYVRADCRRTASIVREANQ